jgi:ankyrin repeat protein
MLAAGKGDLAVVKALLEAPALRIDARDVYCATALRMSAQASSLPVVEALLEARADVSATDNNSATPLFDARSAAVANALIDAGADVNHRNRNGTTPIFYTKDCEIMETLINRNADVSVRTLGGATVLWVALDKRMDLMQLLLAVPAAALLLNVQNSQGVTVLSSAVNYNFPDIVDALLAAGADPHIADRRGYTPLMFARNAEMARRLLDHGVDVNAHVPSAGTALTLAAGNEDKDASLVALLLERGADVNASRTDGCNALMLAADKGRVDIMKLLLAADPAVDINQRNKWGLTALFTAVESNRIIAAELLLKAGACPRTANNDGLIPLMQCQAPESVKMLVDAAPDTVNYTCSHGGRALGYLTSLDLLEELFASSARHNIQIDVNHADVNGDTALHMAMEVNSEPAVVKLLLDKGADVFRVGFRATTVLMRSLFSTTDSLIECPYGEAEKVMDSTLSERLRIIMDHVLSVGV